MEETPLMLTLIAAPGVAEDVEIFTPGVCPCKADSKLAAGFLPISSVSIVWILLLISSLFLGPVPYNYDFLQSLI